MQLINLVLYRAPALDSIRYTYRKYPTYLYSFDYRGAYHRFGHLENPLPFEADATLSDDNIYLFPYPEEVAHLNAADLNMAKTLTSMWINFAMYEKPTFDASLWSNVSNDYGPFVRFTNNKVKALELDTHFGEGIPVPNLYPEYFTTTTTTTTRAPRRFTTPSTTTTTTISPYARYPQYNQYNPSASRYPQQPNQYRPAYQPQYSNYPPAVNSNRFAYPNRMTVLNNEHSPAMQEHYAAATTIRAPPAEFPRSSYGQRHK